MKPVRMEMKWAKKCPFCGNRIEAGQIGFGEKIADSLGRERWEFQCSECHPKSFEDKITLVDDGFAMYPQLKTPGKLNMFVESFPSSMGPIAVLVDMKIRGFAFESKAASSAAKMVRGEILTHSLFGIAECEEIEPKSGELDGALDLSALLNSGLVNERDKEKVAKAHNPLKELKENAKWSF